MARARVRVRAWGAAGFAAGGLEAGFAGGGVGAGGDDGVHVGQAGEAVGDEPVASAANAAHACGSESEN